MVDLRELMMILELHRQGLSVSAIAERTGHDRKTVRKYIRRGLVAPKYTARGAAAHGDRSVPGLSARAPAGVAAADAAHGCCARSGTWGYAGGKTALGDFLRSVRPAAAAAVRGALRNTGGPAGAGRLRRVPGRASPLRRMWSARCGCLPWCWVTAGICGRSSCCIRTWPRCCAVTWRRSSTSAARRARSCTTA